MPPSNPSDWRKQLQQSLNAWLKQQDYQHLLVGVSGGPDSVFLVRLLRELKSLKSLQLAHVNHQLRGAESDGDEVFVRQLAAELDLPLHVRPVDTQAESAQSKENLEATARRLRYRYFQSLCHEHQLDAVAIAHTLDDQVETMLLNFIRGAGPEGLSGMQPLTELNFDPQKPALNVWRPLLAQRKDQLIAWLEQNGLRYRLDSSNLDPSFRRNKLRAEVIPALLSINPQLHDTLERTRNILAQEQSDRDERMQQLLHSEALFTLKSKLAFHLRHSELLPQATSDQRSLLMHLMKEILGADEQVTFDHINRMLELAHAGHSGDSLSLPGGVTVERTAEELRIRKPDGKPSVKPPEPVLLKLRGTTTWNHQTFRAKQITGAEVTQVKQQVLLTPEQIASTEAYLDADQLGDRPRLRAWQAGDSIEPLGLGGSKKLHDLFIDAKIPREERYQWPVVEADGEVVWVPGLALSERVKITPETQTVYHLWQESD